MVAWEGGSAQERGYWYTQLPYTSTGTVPLLRRVDNVEHRTESIEADMKAKTDRIEEKLRVLGQALEEMNKKMEKITNSGNSL